MRSHGSAPTSWISTKCLTTTASRSPLQRRPQGVTDFNAVAQGYTVDGLAEVLKWKVWRMPWWSWAARSSVGGTTPGPALAHCGGPTPSCRPLFAGHLPCGEHLRVHQRELQENDGGQWPARFAHVGSAHRPTCGAQFVERHRGHAECGVRRRLRHGMHGVGAEDGATWIDSLQQAGKPVDALFIMAESTDGYSFGQPQTCSVS